MDERVLIIFIKNFDSKAVKTRLSRTIGVEKALEIYKAMCSFTVSEALSTGSLVYLFFSEYIDTDFMDRWFTADFANRLRADVQKGEDLGEKMHRSFQDILQLHPSALLMGTDCPYFDRDGMIEALERLQAANGIVIGPSEDGGYYAIGMKKAYDLFSDIEWSTERVLDQTLDKMKQYEVRPIQLPCLNDIDFEADWNRFIDSPAAEHYYTVIRSSSS